MAVTEFLISILFVYGVAEDCPSSVGLCEWSSWDPLSDSCQSCGYRTVVRRRSLCCQSDWDRETCISNCDKQDSDFSDTIICDFLCKNGGKKIGYFRSNSFYSSCFCAAGYTGECCEIEIDKCLSSPCQNGGTCHDSINKFTCECPPRIYGDLCETGVCQPSVADIALVLDSSISQTEKEFHKQLEFIVKFLDYIVIGDDNLRVAVITYSSEAVTEITFDKYTDKELLKEAVGAIKYRPGATFTDKGLQAAKSLFTDKYIPRSNGREGKGFVFVLTDGMSNNRQETKKAATELKSYVYKVVSVGIGHEISHDELLSIASKEDQMSYVYSVENFDALHTLLKQLVHLTCDECVRETVTNVMLLLDSTSNMTLEDFQIAQSAMTKLTLSIIETETTDRIVNLALATFDTGVRLHRGLNETASKNALLPQIQKLNLMTSAYCPSSRDCESSALANVIEFTRTYMSETLPQRNDTRNVVIFLTNGKLTLNDDVLNQITLLEEDNIFLQAIATGRSSDINALKRLVKDPTNVYTLLDKNSLMPVDALISEIFFNNCNLTNDFVNN